MLSLNVNMKMFYYIFALCLVHINPQVHAQAHADKMNGDETNVDKANVDQTHTDDGRKNNNNNNGGTKCIKLSGSPSYASSLDGVYIHDGTLFAEGYPVYTQNSNSSNNNNNNKNNKNYYNNNNNNGWNSNTNGWNTNNNWGNDNNWENENSNNAWKNEPGGGPDGGPGSWNNDNNNKNQQLQAPQYIYYTPRFGIGEWQINSAYTPGTWNNAWCAQSVDQGLPISSCDYWETEKGWQQVSTSYLAQVSCTDDTSAKVTKVTKQASKRLPIVIGIPAVSVVVISLIMFFICQMRQNYPKKKQKKIKQQDIHCSLLEPNDGSVCV